jgi:DNA modification methylase
MKSRMGQLAPRSLAVRINAAHVAFQAAMRDGIPHAVLAGELLNQAKQGLAHGQWVPWLRANFKGSVRTAQTYMSVAASAAAGRPANAQIPALLGQVSELETEAVEAPAPATRQRARAMARRTSAAPSWRLTAADCRLALAAEPAESADLVFADPPFNVGYPYRSYDDNLTDAEYLLFSRQWMEEVLRVLKPGGSFYLAIGDEYVADLCCIARRELGLTMRNWIIWHYTFGQQRKSKWVNSHTHILYFTKGPQPTTFNFEAVLVPSARQAVYLDRRANPEGKMPDDVWTLRPDAGCFPPEGDVWKIPRVSGTFLEREGWHPCQMPQAVSDRILKASSNPGDMVIDPFNGSGTTGKSALALGRRYLGIDIDEFYVTESRASLAALAGEAEARRVGSGV